MPETKVVKGCKDCPWIRFTTHIWHCGLHKDFLDFDGAYPEILPDWCPLRTGPVLVSLGDVASVERPKPPDTVRVRIAVAVDPTGKWCASGWKGAGSDDLLDIVLEGVGKGERVSWVEADVPMPGETTIEGVVVEGGEG